MIFRDYHLKKLSKFRLAIVAVLIHAQRMRKIWILPAIIIATVILFRVIAANEFLPNFSPLPALFLCSLIFLRGTKAWLLPVSAWVITDPVVSLIQGYPIIGPHHLGIALGLSATIGLGLWLRKHQTAPVALLGSVGAAVAFYLITNTLVFFGSPLYPNNLAGFVQAQWTGPVGYGPTWMFLRNLLAANLVFTGIFLAARHTFAIPAATASSPEQAAANAR